MAEIDRLVAEALHRGAEARNAYFSDTDDPVSQLRTPAHPENLATLETRIGTRLSPTFRAFFLASDGWDFVSATISLMPCVDVANACTNGVFSTWFDKFWDEDFGHRENAVILGRSTMTNGAYVMVLDAAIEPCVTPRSPDGEFRLVYVDESTDFEYESFLDFLEQTERDYRELAADE